MICPFCRAENIEGADECSNCGKPLYGLDLPGATKREQAPAFVSEPIVTLPMRLPAQVGMSDPVTLAIREMQAQSASCVLVMEGERTAGIITGWDILHKVAGAKDDLNAIVCHQIMTADPLCLHESDSIAIALNMMAHGEFRHVPILRDDKPIGVVDINDLFRYISPNLV